MMADLLFARREVKSRSFSPRDTKDRIAGTVAANNRDFIVHFNLRTPLSTWPLLCPPITTTR